MTVAVLNAAELTAALVTQIAQFPSVDSLGARVESNEPINRDIGRCPWVGVYEVDQALRIRTIGAGSGFRMQRIALAIVMTEASVNSGRDAEERLERLIAAVADAVLSDASIGGKAEITTDDVTVTYSSFREESGVFFKEAIMRIAVECPVRIN